MGDLRGWMDGELLHEAGEEQEKLHLGSHSPTHIRTPGGMDMVEGYKIYEHKNLKQSGQRQKLSMCDFFYFRMCELVA